MAYTDRELRKAQEKAQLAGTSAANSSAEVEKIHTRSRDFTKVGTENAETNVAETVMYTVNRKSAVRSVKYLTKTNTAQDASNYVKVTVTKRTAGASATTVATYNTHNSAEGSIVEYVPAEFDIVPNSDAILAAGDTLSYTVTKTGSGVVLPIGTITVDLEEV